MPRASPARAISAGSNTPARRGSRSSASITTRPASTRRRSGRFMQTDPVGYEDQVNLYAYVGNDPVNKADPSGAFTCYSTSYGQHCVSDGTFIDNIAVLTYKYMVEHGWISMMETEGGRAIRPSQTPPAINPRGRPIPILSVRGGTGSRTYGPDGFPLTDRDTPHPNHKPPGCGDHCHDWGRPAGGGPPTAADRGPPRLPRPGRSPYTARS